MLTFIIIYLVFSLISIVIIFYLMAKSEYGFEDETGYHKMEGNEELYKKYLNNLLEKEEK